MSLISGNENKIFARGEIGNVRKAQEDSHGYKLGTPNGDLFVVCDGMGGHVGGATASRIAVDSIVEHIDKERYATPIEALNGALQFANMQILGHADAHPELKGMGTTACIVLVQGDGVWIAHVGDSRIYLYLGKEKQLHRITKDHSYVQTLVDAGEITDEEAEHHPNKNRILKALGIKSELQPTFNYENRPIHPKNDDIFLICSDGLSGMIPDRTISSVLGEDSLTLQQKGDTLIDRAMDGETICPGGQDNCTVELIEIDNSKYTTSEFKSYNPASATYGENTQKPEAAAPKQTLSNHSTTSTNANIGENKTKGESMGIKMNSRRIQGIAVLLAILLVVGGVVSIVFADNDTQNATEIEDPLEQYTEQEPDKPDSIANDIVENPQNTPHIQDLTALNEEIEQQKKEVEEKSNAKKEASPHNNSATKNKPEKKSAKKTKK